MSVFTLDKDHPLTRAGLRFVHVVQKAELGLQPGDVVFEFPYGCIVDTGMAGRRLAAWLIFENRFLVRYGGLNGDFVLVEGKEKLRPTAWTSWSRSVDDALIEAVELRALAGREPRRL